MAPPPIRIRFRRSGGFAGIPLTAATTADQLAGDHAAQVQRLLTEAEAPGGAHLGNPHEPGPPRLTGGVSR
jgi:hypothetical protein